MSLMSYQGRLKNGRFIPLPSAKQRVPKDANVIMTVLDEVKSEEKQVKKRLADFYEFLAILDENDEELGPEFDEILIQRVNITRELDL